MRELLAEVNQVLDEGRPAVYCSVVETRGSTPQKAGAAMLIFPDGSQRGTLGGGCVEAEVKQRALRVLGGGESERSAVLTFNLDDNYGWDDGLICGGRMSILAIPLPTASSAQREMARRYFRTFQELVAAGQGCTEAVILGGEAAGQRFLLDAAGTLCARLPEDAGAEAVQLHLQPVQRRPKPYAVRGIAYLPIWPRITVFLVGGGHVGQAVAKLAAEVDFDIWVLDDRASYASTERFPTAQRRLVGDIGQSLAQLIEQDITPATFCLIVTRGHNHDEEALYYLARSQAGYVGMIGSKRKIRLIFEDLTARGIPRSCLERVHAPLGFHIGSQTVPEIAISIVAELIACRNLGATIAAARLQVSL